MRSDPDDLSLAVFHFPPALSLADWKGARRSQIIPSFGSSRAISRWLIVSWESRSLLIQARELERLPRV